MMGSTRSRWIPATLVAALGVSLVDGSGSAGPVAPISCEPETIVRTQDYKRAHAFSGGNEHSDNPPSSISFTRVRFTTPPTEMVDVTAALTLSYRTSRGDLGYLSAGLRPVTAGISGSFPMPPGPFWLRPAPPQRAFKGFGVATVTWAKKNLPAEGAEYVFGASVIARDGSGEGRVWLYGRKYTLVLTLKPRDPGCWQSTVMEDP